MGYFHGNAREQGRLCTMHQRQMVYAQTNGDTMHTHAQSTACTGHQALVAVARAEHLPAAAPARAAHPHPA